MERPPEGQPSPPLFEALKDAVGLFTQLKIPYALVGGIAAMVYGRARFTEDVDLVAASNHQTILAANPDAMRHFHFDPATTWKLYHASGVSVDIWKDPHSDAIALRAQTLTLADLSLRIAEVHDLIAMKLRANRPQDDYDISEVLRTSAINESRLATLITQAQLDSFRALKARVSK